MTLEELNAKYPLPATLYFARDSDGFGIATTEKTKMSREGEWGFFTCVVDAKWHVNYWPAGTKVWVPFAEYDTEEEAVHAMVNICYMGLSYWEPRTKE